MTRKVLFLVLSCLAAVAFLTACGGPKTIKLDTPHGAQSHTCDSDYFMQCALPMPSKAQSLLGARLNFKVRAQGVDFGWGGPTAASMLANGKTIGASYFSFDLSKNWTRSLVNSYHAHHIATVGVWESTQFRARDGGFSGGVLDAETARSQAAFVGNTNRPIYFAVDYDTTPNPSAINAYFRGVDSVLGVARVGSYGGLATTSYLFNHHLVKYGWQTYAWSSGCGGTCWDPRAQFQQYHNDVNIGGIDTDLDRAVAVDYGQWPFKTIPVDPAAWAVLDRTVRHFGNVHASEYNTIRTWYRHNCRQPVRRPVCKSSAFHLKLLEVRIVYVAHHGGKDLHRVANPPRWGLNHLGERHLILDRALKGR